MTPGSVLFYTYIVCAGFMVWGTDQHCSTTTNVVLVHAHLTSSLMCYAHFSYCFLIYPHESGTRHLSVLCKGPRQLLPAAYSVAQHYINSLVHPECIIFRYFTPHIARFNWMGDAGWLLPVFFLHVATMHENGTVRKLLTVHQQVSTTRALKIERK